MKIRRIRCDRPVWRRFQSLGGPRGVTVDVLGPYQGFRTPEFPLLRHGQASPSWHDDAVEAYKNYRLVRGITKSDTWYKIIFFLGMFMSDQR